MNPHQLNERVLVCARQPLMREAVARLLAHAGADVVAQASGDDGLRRKVAGHAPDVVVIVATHPGEALAAAVRLRHAAPGVGVLVVAKAVDQEAAVGLLADGAAGVGYLLED